MAGRGTVDVLRGTDTVRLTIPAEVAHDLDALREGFAELAARLGHPGCASGCDGLLVQQEREFTFNRGKFNSDPMPAHAIGRIRRANRSWYRSPRPSRATSSG